MYDEILGIRRALGVVLHCFADDVKITSVAKIIAELHDKCNTTIKLTPRGSRGSSIKQQEKGGECASLCHWDKGDLPRVPKVTECYDRPQMIVTASGKLSK